MRINRTKPTEMTVIDANGGYKIIYLSRSLHTKNRKFSVFQKVEKDTEYGKIYNVGEHS